MGGVYGDFPTGEFPSAPTTDPVGDPDGASDIKTDGAADMLEGMTGRTNIFGEIDPEPSASTYPQQY